MIPKTINYIWLSEEEVSDPAYKECIETWYKFCPDYNFVKWGPSCVSQFLNESEFFKRYWEKENYAFCSDFLRFWILYNYGGFYLDCDVKLHASLDKFTGLQRYLGLARGFSSSRYGIGNSVIEIAIMGASIGDQYVGDVLSSYSDPSIYSRDNIFGPYLADLIIQTKGYSYSIVHSLKEASEYEGPRKIALFDRPGFDSGYRFGDFDYSGPEHISLKSWCTIDKM